MGVLRERALALENNEVFFSLYFYSSPTPIPPRSPTRTSTRTATRSATRTRTPRGDSHIKGARMLVVSLRGVNFGFWSHLGCSGQKAIIFNREGLV